MKFNNQKKGMLLAFTAIMFITPDSLLIRLANIESWNLIFYRGFIPFLVVFVGLIFIYKKKLLKELINNGWHGVAYAFVFTITNIVFVISIENTNVANTLIMIALAPMLSAIISFVFLKEIPDQKTWVAITITTLAVIYIFYDALDAGDFLGNFLGLVAAMGLAVGANIIRSAKKISLVPSAMIGKLMVALIAMMFANQLKLESNDIVISDSKKTLAFAGIIGSSNSHVTNETKTILLESASIIGNLDSAMCLIPNKIRNNPKVDKSVTCFPGCWDLCGGRFYSEAQLRRLKGLS